MKFTISLGQMDIQFGNPAANFETVKRMTEAAKGRGSEIIIFPELWSTGYDLSHASRYATRLDSGLFPELASLAHQSDVHIVGSTLSLMDEHKYGNTVTVYAPDGSLLGVYSKIHLFRQMQEDRYLSAGDKIKTTDLPFCKAGLAICYDLRFPELFRALRIAGADMILLPSEWPHPRLSHWRTLIQARAIENQMFILACNRVGSDPDNKFCGHSMVVDPWGEILAEGGEEEELITASVDLAGVQDARNKIPILQDRRPDVYEG